MMRLRKALSKLWQLGRGIFGRKSSKPYPPQSEEVKRSKLLKLTSYLEIIGYPDNRLAGEAKKALGNSAWQYDGWFEIVEGKRNPEMKTEAREKLAQVIYEKRTKGL